MAEDQSSADERTREPSEHKLRKAAQDGKLSKSAELTAFGAWGLGVLGLSIWGEQALHLDFTDMKLLLARLDQYGLGDPRPVPPLPWRFGLLLFGAMALGACLAGGLQPGRPNLKSLAPKLSNLSSKNYVSNRFGAKGLLEYVKNAVKAFCFALVTFAVLSNLQLGLYPKFDFELDTAKLLTFLWRVALFVLPFMTVFALVDILKNRRFDRAKLRVTPQEEKREAKEEGGDAERKARQRAQAQSLTQQNLPLAVQKADVVIANPEHFAVCLAWAREPGTAPICVAKGQDEVALTIRRLAAEAGVPVYLNPPTARALFATTKLDQEVPHELYRAVAAAIRFADDLKSRRKKSVF